MADNRKLAAGLRNLPASAREDLAGREQDIQRGKTVELLRRAGKEMYENPIVNTAIGFTPVLGDIQAAGETMAALNRGAPWQETAGYAAGMLPFIPMIGKTVWHGSPHTFDKFDLSKIGTGEGAQAYGHGLYLADAPEVAKEYQQKLSDSRFISGSGKDLKDMPSSGGFAPMMNEMKMNGRTDEEIANTLRRISEGNHPYAKNAGKLADKLEAGKLSYKTGNLYKVDLPDEQIAKMLDWDKPLSQQAPEVLQALEQSPQYQHFANINQQNPNLYQHPSEFEAKKFYGMIGESPEDASRILREQGIPGIQYLDQASRGAGDGTRNYVVFSDEIPQILERNNQPVAQALRNYGLEHRPMTIEGGASQLHELTPSFGEDVYGKQAMQFFGSGDPREKKALEIMKSVRGNPDAPVTIYRGVPEGVNQINQGDWVTIVPEVAADYGNVISQQVPASHITSWPDSLMEFGYYPPKAK